MLDSTTTKKKKQSNGRGVKYFQQCCNTDVAFDDPMVEIGVAKKPSLATSNWLV